MQAEGRLTCHEWDNRYDTRHVVFQPARMPAQALEDGYWRAYRQFYAHSQPSVEATLTKPALGGKLRHLAYTGAWKKAEPAPSGMRVIRQGWLPYFRQALEQVLESLPGHNQKTWRRAKPLLSK